MTLSHPLNVIYVMYVVLMIEVDWASKVGGPQIGSPNHKFANLRTSANVAICSFAISRANLFLDSHFCGLVTSANPQIDHSSPWKYRLKLKCSNSNMPLWKIRPNKLAAVFQMVVPWHDRTEKRPNFLKEVCHTPLSLGEIFADFQSADWHTLEVCG